MPSKKQKWCLAYLTGRVPAELQGQPPEEPTCGEVVAFISALDPQLARKYSADYYSGQRFKQKVEQAFEQYRVETEVPEPKVKLLKLKKKGSREPMDFAYVMDMPGSEYQQLVFDGDGKARPGVREALAQIITDGPPKS
jgi:hypothetical protein